MTNETSEKIIKDLGIETVTQKKISIKHFILGVVVTSLILAGLSVLFLFSLYWISL